MKFYVKLDRLGTINTQGLTQGSLTGMAAAMINGNMTKGVNIEYFDLMQSNNVISSPPVIPQNSTPIFYVLDNRWNYVPIKVLGITQILKFSAVEDVLTYRRTLTPIPGSITAEDPPHFGWEGADSMRYNPPQFDLFVRTSSGEGSPVDSQLLGSAYNKVARTVGRGLTESITTVTREFTAYQGRRAWVSTVLDSAFPSNGVNFISPAITIQGITSEHQTDYRFSAPIIVSVAPINFSVYHTFYMELEIDNAALTVNNPNRPGLPPDAWLIIPAFYASRDWTSPVSGGSPVPCYHHVMGLPDTGPSQPTQPIWTCPIQGMADAGGLTLASGATFPIPYFDGSTGPFGVDVIDGDIVSNVVVSPLPLNPYKDAFALGV